MNKRIKSLVMLVPFAAGLISGDAVFASSSLEKSKMLIGRGKKNLADAVDKNDVNCDEELSLSGNKTENKIKDISDKNTQASRFGLLGFLGINGAIASIGITNFSTKELVKLLQKDKEKEKITPSDDDSKSSPGPVGLTPSDDDSKSSPGPVGLTPSNNDSNSSPGPVGPTTIKEKPYGDISLWIKENPKVFFLVVILFTAFLIFNVRNRRAINKLNEEIKKSNEIFRRAINKLNEEVKKSNEEVKKSNEEIKELNERLELNEIGKKLSEEIDEEIENIGKFIGNINYLKDFKNYKAILKQIISGNTDKTLTLILFNNNNFDSEDIFLRVKAFYALAGRFYDTLEGFWYVVLDEDKIKEKLKKKGGFVDTSDVFPDNARIININFFSIDDYLTKLRAPFDKVKTKEFYNDDFRIGEKMFYLYYETFFNGRLDAPYRDYKKKLEITSELGFNEDFYSKQKFKNKDVFVQVVMDSVSPKMFYKFLSSGGFFAFIYDDRNRASPEIRIRFIKYAIEKLIKDGDGIYKLSDDNKIFLKGRFNALLLFGKLIDAYLKKKGGNFDRTDIINMQEFHYWVLNWCKEKIKNKNLVHENNKVFENEVIFFLARMEAEYLIDLGGKKNGDVEKTFGEILDIYKGNPVTIYNDNNKFIDRSKYANLKDANINFEQIQFMK